MARVACIAFLLVVAVAGLGACDEGSEPPPVATRLAGALASVQGSDEAVGVGVGWLDQERVRDLGLPATALAAALGPNASSVLESAAALDRRFGFDPRQASRLVSTGGSYAYGLRLDGLDGARLPEVLGRPAAGAAPGPSGYRLVDAGPYAVVPEPLLRAGVRGLGARDAFGREAVVLAISDDARERLMGGEPSLIESSAYASAAGCLGDVIAARLVPDRLVQSTELGSDLVAVGVVARAARLDRERICLVGGAAADADRASRALRRSLRPAARDPVTGARIRRAVESAAVRRLSIGGNEVVRVDVRPAPGQQPGYVFGALARGSLAAFLYTS